MAIAAGVLAFLVLLIGLRGRRKRAHRVADTAAGIARAHRPWDGPDRWRGKPATRSPRRAAAPRSDLPARTLARFTGNGCAARKDWGAARIGLVLVVAGLLVAGSAGAAFAADEIWDATSCASGWTWDGQTTWGKCYTTLAGTYTADEGTAMLNAAHDATSVDDLVINVCQDGFTGPSNFTCVTGTFKGTGPAYTGAGGPLPAGTIYNLPLPADGVFTVRLFDYGQDNGDFGLLPSKPAMVAFADLVTAAGIVTTGAQVDPSPLPQPGWGGPVLNAVNAGYDSFTGSILYTLLICGLWVGFLVVRRLVRRV